MWQAFEHRSGRVIAVGRLLIAIAFIIAIWIDPRQPGPNLALATYGLMGGYMALTLVLLGFTWADWWLDYRLALPSHILDMLFFAAVAVVTEGQVSTPFFAIFLFLVIAAFRRFGWRAAAITAGGALLLFSVGGLLALHFELATQRWDRFILRRYYLVLLTVLVVWFGLNQLQLRGQWRQRRGDELDLVVRDGDEPMASMAADAGQRFNGARARLVWHDPDEPWIWLADSQASGNRQSTLPPDLMEPDLPFQLAGSAMLYDLGRQRSLQRDRQGRFTLLRHTRPLPEALAQALGLREGLMVPVLADRLQALLIVEGINGMCSDDLNFAQHLAETMAASLNRHALLQLTTEAAIDRTRLALARDIHDSVLQMLAALGFRLEVLRRQIGSDAGAEQQLNALARELTRSQQELRDYIGNLRDEAGEEDAIAALAELATSLTLQWGADCRFQPDTPAMVLPAQLLGEIRQLVREMVANAARHGKAHHITIGLQQQKDQIWLSVADDGVGFPAGSDGTITKPWSLSERVHALGGKLRVDSGPRGSTITIILRSRD